MNSENIDKIAGALAKAQAEMGAVVKGADNPFYKSKYADINAVIKAVKEPLNNNGISFLQNTKLLPIGEGKHINIIETVLLHSSGQFLTSQTEIIYKQKDDAQKFGAAVTYARRFGLQAMCGLPAEDDDGNSLVGNKPKVAPKKPTAKKAPDSGFRTKKKETVVESSDDGI